MQTPCPSEKNPYIPLMNDLGMDNVALGARVVVAMSGGVDSSTVAALMVDAGYDVVGVTLQLYDHGEAIGRKGACCAGQDIHDARRVFSTIPRIASVTLGSGGVIVAYRTNRRSFVEEVNVQSQLFGDPTGCGDVWGAVMCGRLLDGMSGVDAAHVANRFAPASLDHRRMEGLVERLTDVPFDILGDSFLNSATEVEL